MMRPGDQLRELRNRLGVTTREVEEFSRTIAEDRQNEEFYISNAWLTQLENKNSVPSIYKLYSLSVIYRTKFHDLLGIFGIDLNASSRYQLALPLQKTHLTSYEVPDAEKAITFPVRFDKSFSLETTSLISRMVEVWGEIPIALLAVASAAAWNEIADAVPRAKLFSLLDHGNQVVPSLRCLSTINA